MAALDKKPKTRVHFPVRFAAGALRVAAVLAVVAGGVATYAIFYPSQIPGADAIYLPGIFAVVVAALIVWGFADGLLLLADLDDSQRLVQAQLADLVLEARTGRGPFHHEIVAAAKSEEPVLKKLPRTEEPPALKA